MLDQTRSFSRRRFLSYGAKAAGLSAVAGIGWQFRPTQKAFFAQEPLSPDTTTRPKLLIAYASMMGSTGGQAETVAHTARMRGYAVQLSLVAQAPAPSGFDAVILGSAIKSGEWLPQMIDYANAYQDEIAARPHGLFQCSMTCSGFRLSNPVLRAQDRIRLRIDMNSLVNAAPRLASAPHEFLSGRLDYDHLSPFQRFGYPLLSGSLLRGDFRNPKATADFTNRLLERHEFRVLIT